MPIRARRTQRSRVIRLLATLAAVVLTSVPGLFPSIQAAADTPPTPPFTQCPGIGQDTSCGLLIVVNSNGTTSVLGDPSQPPFDGVEDTLVGVQNNSGQTVNIIPISSSSSIPIFDFDYDGICAGYYANTPALCPFGASGYEGPNTSFTVTDPNNGTLNFPNGLAPGQATYFSLEGGPTPGSIIIPRYVALGDSYSSGEGVPPFIPSTDKSTNMCHRSMGAYPELIVGRSAVPPNVEFWACSGATIRDFYNPSWGEAPQLDDLNGATPTLVTVGVGGNDIGFDTIGRTCTSVNVPFQGEQNSDYHKDCKTFLDKPDQLQPEKLINGLTSGNVSSVDGKSYSLKQLYQDMRGKAPVGRIFVIGYPNPLPTSDAASSDCQADVLRENGNTVGFAFYNAQFKVAQSDVDWMEKIIAHLNSTVQLNALNSGFYFVDNSLTLKGHDVCGNSTDHWVHGVVLKNSGSTSSEWSFHPNGKGQTAWAKAVASAIAGPPAGGFVAKVAPGQYVQQFISASPGEYRLIIQTAWPGSDVQLSLVSPTGVVYDRTTTTAGVIHQLQANSESFSIPTPEAGQWTVRLYGANVPASGEQVRVDVTQIAQTAFAPVAQIALSTDRAVVPASIQADGSNSTAYNGATIASYSWDFGDGTPPVSGPVQAHVFATPGSHAVTLTVTDSNGQSDHATRSVSLTATDQPPDARFIWGSLDSTAATQVSFDASTSTDIDGQITSYAWNFGDGTTGSGQLPAHNYAAAGTYPVTLTVTDNGGLSTSVCQGVRTGAFSGGPVLPCTTTTLTSSANPAFVGQPISLTATVSPVAPATGIPDGSVTFFDGATPQGTVAVDAAGLASLTTSTLAVGHHTITAVYSGSVGFAGSRSAALVQVVRQNKIAFTSHRDGNWEIYTMKPDGTGQTRLTANPALDTSPAYSPDGTRIAFVSTRSGRAQIWAMKGDGSDPAQLTADPGLDATPTWSPDGKKIAYTSTRSGRVQIWILDTSQPLSAGNPTQLTADSFASADATPAWSPIGGQIAFASTRSGSPQIWVMDAHGSGTPVQLTNTGSLNGTPAWSPDGSKIAFTSAQSGSVSINVMNANGSGVTRLTNKLVANVWPSWSPDGARIAFTTGTDDTIQVHVIDLASLADVTITSGPPVNALPSWCCVQAP